MGLGTDETIDFATVPEHDEGGDPLDAESSLGAWCPVDVHLDEFDLAGELVGEFLQRR